MKAILPLAAFLALASTALAQKTPDEALQTFTVADGLQLELFASEPMFVNPTCIDVDHKGRVWVCESVNYRCDLRKAKRNRAEGDRLVVLEDTDGDGKADKSHTFYQEKDFIAPLGVAVMPYPDGKGQRVYVCHSPHIYVFEDKDGDLKADAAPKILLTGFKGYDHDHGVHGIHFGPDGKLYFSVGDQGVQGLKSANGNFKEDRETGRQGDKEKSWTTNRSDCQAATVWRCNTDGSNLELLAHNFRNPYEPAVDSFGTVFISDNDDDGNQQTRICYVMYGGNYGYWPRGKGESHWHEEQPGIVHKVLRTGFGSPTGMCWYEGTLLREAFLASGGRKPSELKEDKHSEIENKSKAGDSSSTRGVSSPRLPVIYGLLLHTDAGPREVRCFVVKSKGAGYELDKLNLVTSTDNWFRPSDVCVAPDGSVFVSDWYDPGVGGHGMGDTTRGRIYRITPKGHKAYKVPDVDFAKTERLLQAIKSPNLASRQFGVAGLLELPAQSANEMGKLEDLFRSVTDQSSDPALRARGLRIHARLSQTGINYWLGDLLLHSDPRIRQSVIRIFNEQRGIPPHNFVSHGQGLHWANVLKDTSAAVRRDALLALARVDPTQTGDGQTTVGGKIIDLAKLYDGQDPFYLAAINIAVGTDAKRREIILADFEKHFPEWNDKTAKLVWELRPPQVIAKLDQKLTDPKLTAEQKAQIMEILAFAEGDTGGKVYLKLLAAKGASAAELAQATKGLVKHLPARWAGLKKSDEMKAALERLLADSKTAPLALEIIQAGELAEYVEPVRSIASQDSQPAENRQAAVRALGGIKTPQALKALLGLWESNILNLEVIDALGRHSGPEAIATLGKVALNGSQAPDLNDAAVAALAGSRPGTQWLLEAHAQKKLPESMVSSVARLLRISPHQDLRNRALIAFPAPAKLDPKKLPGIATLVTRRGDAEHGREVFRTNKEVACIRCHAVRGVGGNIGPDLSMIGKKGSRENLFESIIRPDKAIGDQYIQWVVLDKRGVSLSGLLIEETPEHIVIRDGFGKDNKLWTKDIEEKAKSKKSVMPDDAVAQMTEQDLIDVVAYLETLRTPALTPESWHILGPFDNGQNDAGLDKAFIPEPASGGRKPPEVDLKATHDGKDDKIGWRTIRLGADGYYNLQAFHRFAARDTVSYLYREIESPADQEVTILIGTDDGCKLWVNGELLLQHRRHEAATPERDTVKVKHRKGGNAVLLKISNGDGPHGFYFTLVSEQELKENAGAPKGGQP